MIYSLKTALGTWVIQPVAENRWILKRQQLDHLRSVLVFDSAAEAADAVGQRRTSELDWDRSPIEGDVRLADWEKTDPSTMCDQGTLENNSPPAQPDPAAPRLKRTQFWGRDADDDHLVHQIFAGEKTASVGLARDWLRPDGDFDDGGYVAGDLLEVYDRRGRLRGHIRVTEVYPTTFGQIPEKLWRGEACTSAEDFKNGHRACWSDEALTDETPIVAFHFKLVAPPRAPHAPP